METTSIFAVFRVGQVQGFRCRWGTLSDGSHPLPSVCQEPGCDGPRISDHRLKEDCVEDSKVVTRVNLVDVGSGVI